MWAYRAQAAAQKVAVRKVAEQAVFEETVAVRHCPSTVVEVSRFRAEKHSAYSVATYWGDLQQAGTCWAWKAKAATCWDATY